MLDQFFEVACTQDAVKTANAKVQEKLRSMPLELLHKLASSEKTAWNDLCSPKSAGDSGGPVSWLDQFKNTPLFDKALELERADLQLEQEDIKQRQAQMGQETWVKRDALRLQRRLLELDLVLESNGAAGAEQTEEKGVDLLEQAQEEERAAGEGGEPHELKEDAAIQQFRAAQSEEEAAKAQEQPPKEPKEPKKAPLASVDVKEASVAKISHADASGRLLAKIAGNTPEGHHIRRALLGPGNSAAIEAKPELAMQAKMHADGYANQQGWKGLTTGGLIGAGAGGAAGAAAGAHSGSLRNALVLGLGGAALGGATGATLGGAVGSVKGTHDAAASAIHGLYSKNKEAADATEAGKVRADVAKKYPHLAAKTAASKAPAGMSSFYGTPDEATALADQLGASAEHAEANPIKTRLKNGLGGAALGAVNGGMLGGLSGNPKAMLGGALGGGGVGALLGGLAKPGAHTRREEAHVRTQLQPDSLRGEAAELRRDGADVDANPGAYRGRAALVLGGLGAAAGAGIGSGFGSPGKGALIGGGLGAALGAAHKPSGRDFNESADAIDAHLAKHHPKTAGIIGSALTAGKALLPQAASAAKGIGSLASTAYNAGGVGQVAKSLGSVAGGFAKANPLAAAGVAAAGAGAAGLAAGRLSKSNQPQLVRA